MRIQEKIDQLVVDLVNKQFEIAGVDLDYDRAVALNDKFWFNKYTITEAQADELRKWFIQEAKKRLRWSKKRAVHEYSWWFTHQGLKEKDDVNE